MMPPLPGDVQWFPADIRRLILAIKKHPCLYNPLHKEFGLRDIQSRAWRTVAAGVGGGKTDTQCRDKWNCLRGTYRRHVRTEATNNVKRRSGWPWADMMSFIKKHVMDKDELAELRILKMERDKTKHRPNCPASQNNQLQNVTTSANNVPSKPPGLTFAGGILSGGIIFNTNRVGIGIVQPNQSNMGIGIVQPNTPAAVGGGKQSESMPQNVSLGVVQPVQTNLGVKMVHTGQKALVMSKSSVTNTSDPTKLELKSDEDAPKSPDKTEFVDIDVMVKKEYIEEDEMDISEFNFLSEECSQESTQGSDKTAKPNGLTSPEESESDSNQLFMRSTVAHMRQLSAYDQSVFKLKVQHLLHEMMFPTESNN